MRQLFAVTIALAVAGGSAQASDPWGQPTVYQVADPPVYQVASAWPGLFSWSGFYVGGHAGWGWGSFEVGNLGIAPPSRIAVNGGIAGGQVGANWQWGAFVAGVEADVGAKAFKGGDDGTAGSLDQISGRWGGTARVRLAYALDRWMFFATGGGALLNYHYDSTLAPSGLTLTQNRNLGFARSITDSGFVVGAGIEQSFAPNWSAKIEYLHADYGNLVTDEVRAGLNYRWVAPY
jgi:outer membrane immunogenic protein